MALEPQQGSDAAVRFDRLAVVADRQQLGRLLHRQLDRGIGEIVEREEPRAVGRTATLAPRPEPAAVRALDAGHSRELLIQEQHLDAAFVQRLQHLLEPADAALSEPLQRLGLALALELLEAGARGGEDLLGGRAVDVDLDAAGEPFLKVPMQLGLEVRDDLARPADDQALERTTLEVLHEGVGGVLQVVGLLLLDAALVASLRPPALVMLAEDCVVDLLNLSQPVGRASEDAYVAAAHQRDAPALAPLEPGKR